MICGLESAQTEAAGGVANRSTRATSRNSSRVDAVRRGLQINQRIVKWS